jgi:hypothetical protein
MRMMFLAVSAPARCPADRGRAREVAHLPLPSQMIATWRPFRVPAGAFRVCFWMIWGCTSIFLLRRYVV